MGVAGLICLLIFSVPLSVAAEAEAEDGIQQVLLRLSSFQETFQQDPPGVFPSRWKVRGKKSVA